MPLLTSLKPKILAPNLPLSVIEHVVVDLPNRRHVDAHVARYLRSRVKPRLVVFSKQTPLLEWCIKHNVKDAINGGFTLHHTEDLLGEIWIAGKKHKSVDFTKPWHEQRGSLHINQRGHIRIAPRYYFPSQPEGDLLQTAPLLVHKGQSVIVPDQDPEGISASSDQFDDDWTGDQRFPRAAIGANDDFIFCVTTNGYSPDRQHGKDTGLSLEELADLMIKLGATEALNLDGGSSVSLVANGKLINMPRAGHRDDFAVYPMGRPIPNAIIFEPLRTT
jgi:hypothetical protein